MLKNGGRLQHIRPARLIQSKRSIRRKGLIRKFVATLLAFTGVACAQTSRGTVTGTVLDSSGAAIAGASVTLNGEQTGVQRSTESNETGIYRFDAVDLGIYDLTAARPGFRTYLATKIGVEANRVTTVDPKTRDRRGKGQDRSQR